MSQNSSTFKLSLILLTYEWPEALQQVLSSLAQQQVMPDEVIVADDGSGTATKKCVDEMKTAFPCPLHHVWQEDEGFRAAAARNLAVATSKGDYLIFLDGDCLVFKDFIQRHRLLAESKWITAGNRILLNQQLTQQVLKTHSDPINWGWKQWLDAKRKGQVNRLAPLIKLGDSPWRKLRSNRWRGVQSCNLGIWREDFLAVNGFDETFQGWGHEDADLAVRLLQQGCKRKDGNFALPVLHLWHPQLSRALEADNLQRLGHSQQPS